MSTGSEQTDMERNKAIEELKVSIDVAHLEFWQGKSYSNFKLKKETVESAITALRAQSEAENIDEYSVSGMIGILRDIKESGLRAKSNSMRTFGQKDAIDCAISLLHSKSDAERKIEKVREYCKKAISDIGHSQPYVDACEKILDILEES